MPAGATGTTPWGGVLSRRDEASTVPSSRTVNSTGSPESTLSAHGVHASSRSADPSVRAVKPRCAATRSVSSSRRRMAARGTEASSASRSSAADSDSPEARVAEARATRFTARSSRFERASSSIRRSVSSAAPSCWPKRPNALATVASSPGPVADSANRGDPSIGTRQNIALGGTAAASSSRSFPRARAITPGRSSMSDPCALPGSGKRSWNAAMGSSRGQRSRSAAIPACAAPPSSNSWNVCAASALKCTESPAAASRSCTSRKIPSCVASRCADTATSTKARMSCAVRARPRSSVQRARNAPGPAGAWRETRTRAGMGDPSRARSAKSYSSSSVRPSARARWRARTLSASSGAMKAWKGSSASSSSCRLRPSSAQNRSLAATMRPVRSTKVGTGMRARNDSVSLSPASWSALIAPVPCARRACRPPGG